MAASVALIPAIDLLAVIIVLIGFSLTFTATGISMNFTLTNDLVASPNDVGKGFAILNIGANGFGMLAPIVTGYVVQASGRFDLTFYLSGGMLLVGSMLTLIMTHHPIGASARRGRCARSRKGPRGRLSPLWGLAVAGSGFLPAMAGRIGAVEALGSGGLRREGGCAASSLDCVKGKLRRAAPTDELFSSFFKEALLPSLAARRQGRCATRIRWAPYDSHTRWVDSQSMPSSTSKPASCRSATSITGVAKPFGADLRVLEPPHPPLLTGRRQAGQAERGAGRERAVAHAPRRAANARDTTVCAAPVSIMASAGTPFSRIASSSMRGRAPGGSVRDISAWVGSSLLAASQGGVAPGHSSPR